MKMFDGFIKKKYDRILKEYKALCNQFETLERDYAKLQQINEEQRVQIKEMMATLTKLAKQAQEEVRLHSAGCYDEAT